MTVKAVIFDWGGTLTPWHDIDFHEEWLSYARAWGGPVAEQKAMADRIVAAGEAVWRRSRETHRSAHVVDILADAGVDIGDARHPAALAAYLGFWEVHTYTDPQVRPLWEALHDNGIRVGVLSNTVWSREHHRGIFERDGVLDLIDADVYSSEIPWTKPHAEAFRTAAAGVGVEPAEAVYVGDRLFEDVHGPHRVGMRAIWVPSSNIPSNQHIETGDRPDAIARQLLDVLTIVREWA